MSYLTAPASRAAAVTPNDSTDLPGGPTRSVYVGGAGNLVVDMAIDGATVTFTGVAAGSVLPLAVRRVRTSTATSIVALY